MLAENVFFVFGVKVFAIEILSTVLTKRSTGAILVLLNVKSRLLVLLNHSTLEHHTHSSLITRFLLLLLRFSHYFFITSLAKNEIDTFFAIIPIAFFELVIFGEFFFALQTVAFGETRQTKVQAVEFFVAIIEHDEVSGADIAIELLEAFLAHSLFIQFHVCFLTQLTSTVARLAVFFMF